MVCEPTIIPTDEVRIRSFHHLICDFTTSTELKTLVKLSDYEIPLQQVSKKEVDKYGATHMDIRLIPVRHDRPLSALVIAVTVLYLVHQSHNSSNGYLPMGLGAAATRYAHLLCMCANSRLSGTARLGIASSFPSPTCTTHTKITLPYIQSSV